jgi:hypothetical protein
LVLFREESLFLLKSLKYVIELFFVLDFIELIF